VYVLAKEHTLPLLHEIARDRGVPVVKLRRGWWGTLVPRPT